MARRSRAAGVHKPHPEGAAARNILHAGKYITDSDAALLVHEGFARPMVGQFAIEPLWWWKWHGSKAERLPWKRPV